MTPAAPVLIQPVSTSDADVPDYVRELEQAASYLPDDQRALLRRAWAVGAAAHAGQMRKSGEPYITHPVSVATELAGLGFDMNFAPVADVGDGSDLGSRTYGDDPGTVAGFVEAIVAAHLEVGITPVVKHWPGIGGGEGDPHVTTNLLPPLEELRGRDLTVFDRAIAGGAPAIMVAHAVVPGLSTEEEPTSLSAAAITGELRGRQGFDGLVITDSLGMGALMERYTLAEAALAGEERLAEYLSASFYEEAGEHLKRGLDAFEKWCDDTITQKVQAAKFTALGMSPIIAYFIHKEMEIKNARIILSAKQNRLPADIVRQRVRAVYV